MLMVVISTVVADPASGGVGNAGGGLPALFYRPIRQTGIFA